MKLLKRFLHGLGGESRPVRRILDLIQRGDAGGALKLLKRSANLGAGDWQSIASAAATLGPEAEPLLFHAVRAGQATYPLLLAAAQWLVRHGEPLRAFVFCTAAHRLAPAESAPLKAQAEIQFSLGNFRAAASLFLAACQRDETDAQARRKLAEARELAGLPPYAEPIRATGPLDRELPVDNAQAYLDHGRRLVENQRSAEALPLLEMAHHLSDTAESAYWRAAALTMLGRHAEGWEIASVASGQAPWHANLLAMAAECAVMTGRNAEAIALYQAHLALKPDAPASIWSNLGNSLARLERFAEAVPPLEHAVELAPTDIAARLNLAYVLYYAGQETQASAHLDILFGIEQNDFEAHWLRATLLLAQHEFASGWLAYAYRSVQTQSAPDAIPIPLWRGEPLANKTLLITAEQGIGDQIMFISCLSELIPRTGKLIVECEPRLTPLFARSFPSVVFVPHHTGRPTWETQPDIDIHLPMGDLPKYFRPDVPAFQRAHFPFLQPNPDIVLQMRDRLAELGKGLKIGIAWRGGLAATRMRTRSLGLDQLAPITRTPHCHFVSLQYGDCGPEIEQFERAHGMKLHHWPEVIADLDVFASLVQALDLVITVCSAPVHFAGSLGKPAIVLTPHTPEWRYVGIGGRMLWYPSIELIAQPTAADWTSVVEVAKERLGQLIRQIEGNC